MPKILQEDKTQRGIWRFHSSFPPVEREFRLSRGEGLTPETALGHLICKREDQNPTGSIKDRGMAFQVSWAFQNGAKNLVISSSGNAAIAAAAYCQLAKIKLHAFVSPKINQEKLKKVRAFGAAVLVTPRPVSQAVKFATRNNFSNLRPSLGINGSVGYKSLAFELSNNLGKIDSLFLPVSSGVAFLGLAEGFSKIGYYPQFHLVQTTAVCPLAHLFDQNYKASETSLADALVAKVIPGKNRILAFLEKSGGWAWVISDEQIRAAWRELEDAKIQTSAEGAATLAAVQKAREQGKNLGKKIVCVLTGKKYTP